MSRGILSAALAVLFMVGATLAFAQIGERKTGDARVKVLLDKAEYKYTVDEDGDFRLVNTTADDRTHVVFIESKTAKLGDLEIRDVFSVGYISDEEVPASVMSNLLRENSLVKLGAWSISRINGKDAAVFRAKIAADTDTKTLLMTMRAVTSTADAKEKELLKTDDL